MKAVLPLLFLLYFSLPAIGASLPDVIDRVRAGVIGVGTYQPGRRPPVRILGTGFVVGDGRHIVTNHHVLPRSLDRQHKERLAVFTGRGANTRVHGARLLDSDSTHDLALLTLSDGEKLAPLTLAGNRTVREGTEIAFTGFPIGMVLGLYPVTHRGIVSAVTPVVIPAMSSRQLTARIIKRMRNPYKVYQLDATAYPGNSGSPVYLADSGRVVGVINSVLVKSTKEAALSDPTGITYAVPVRYVRQLLKRARQVD